jgi:hypothetical protein
MGVIMLGCWWEACGGATEVGPTEAADDMVCEQLHAQECHTKVPVVWHDAFSLTYSPGTSPLCWAA